MQVPLEITFRDVPRTDDIEALVREKADKLETFCDHITSCRVAIERPQRHQRAGNPYRVRIDITVPPGHEIVVSRDPLDSDMHDDLRTVVNRAFKAAGRQLKELVEKQRGEVKTPQEPRALVVRLFRDEDYGFLKTPEGREIYMHRHSVLGDDWERLAIGTEVRFAESQGAMGPQTSSVQIVNKPGALLSSAEESLPRPPRGWEA